MSERSLMENKKKDAEAMLQRLREEQRKSGKNPFSFLQASHGKREESP